MKQKYVLNFLLRLKRKKLLRKERGTFHQIFSIRRKIQNSMTWNEFQPDAQIVVC